MIVEAPFAEGGNYRCELAQSVAICRVWRRTDLDSAAQARFAEAKVGLSQRLLEQPAYSVRGLILDLREAPPVVGTEAQESYGRMLALWEASGRRIAIVVGDSATQALQITRLVHEYARTCGFVCRDEPTASVWVNGVARKTVLRAPTRPGVEGRGR